MVGLPRAIIKKYGVTKKAWAVFRGTKGRRKTRTSRLSSARVVYVARRRRSKYYGRTRRRGRTRGGNRLFGLSTKGIIPGVGFGLLGVVAAVFAKDMIANAIPINVPFKDKGVAFAIAGPAGVAAAFAKDFLMPSGTSGTSSGGLF